MTTHTLRRRLLRVVVMAALVVWIVVWLRVFGFSFSANSFRHLHGTRLVILIMAMAAVTAPVVSGYWAVTRTTRREEGALKACIVNLVVSGLPLAVFWSVLAVWIRVARRAGELAFEADEAMGIGIVFLFCQAAWIAANLVAVCTIVVLKLIEGKSNDGRVV